MKKIFVFLICLGLLGWGAAGVVKALEYINVCGGTGCGYCIGNSCTGPWVVTYKCDGRVPDCRSNESGWSQNGTATANPGCGQSVQVDVFPKKCRLNDGSWDDSCQPLDFVTVYGGACQNPGPTPTPAPACNSLTTAEVNVNGSGWTSSNGSVKLGDSVQFRAQPSDGRTALFLNHSGLTGRQCSSDVGAGKVCPGGSVTIDSWWGGVGQNISVRAFQFGSNWWTSLGGSCEDSLNLTITAAPTPTPTPTPKSTPTPTPTPQPSPTATAGTATPTPAAVAQTAPKTGAPLWLDTLALSGLGGIGWKLKKIAGKFWV